MLLAFNAGPQTSDPRLNLDWFYLPSYLPQILNRSTATFVATTGIYIGTFIMEW